MKPPVCNGMIAPRDSWMMPPPCNEMIPPGAPPCWLKEVLLPLQGCGSSRFGLFASGAAQALAGEFDAMRIVDEAVQDGVGVSGVANDLMPGRQRELGGDDRRPAAISLLENFEQIVAGAGVAGVEAEVVEDEQIGAAEGLDEARMAPIASGERQILAELRPAMIEDGAIVATGLLADGAGEPTLADAGRADQGQIVMGVDPFALRELLEQGAVQTAGGAIVSRRP